MAAARDCEKDVGVKERGKRETTDVPELCEKRRKERTPQLFRQLRMRREPLKGGFGFVPDLYGALGFEALRGGPRAFLVGCPDDRNIISCSARSV